VGFRARTVQRLSRQLEEGVSVETLALSVAIGFALGICPLFGVPTILCGVAAVVLRLNFPAIQLVNYLVYPLQILLAWPFARLGGLVFGGARDFWALTLHMTLAWFCFAVPAGLVAYLLVRRVLRHRGSTVLSTPEHQSYTQAGNAVRTAATSGTFICCNNPKKRLRLRAE
jgi:uncharacterized protein (DUF2062 family)